ncbi:hypothetical protein MYX64_03775 [Nitrospinae bacterium AH_259_B05_G02_I21]|nr:hypothetical protein [Nitrospinae bacterium AH_259_B05_G02_I21]
MKFISNVALRRFIILSSGGRPGGASDARAALIVASLAHQGLGVDAGQAASRG